MSTKKNKPFPDPMGEREAARYEFPVPSREAVLELLAKRGEPLSFREIADALNVAGERDEDAFARRLRAMERDGQILKNRREFYLLPSKMDMVHGRIEGHPDGFGFLVPEEGGTDLFLSPKEMRVALHGDRVLARIVGLDQRGRREGAIVEVLERARRTIVGRYVMSNHVGFIVPHDRRVSQDILVPRGDELGAQEGQIVVADIVEWPTRRSQTVGRVIEIVGEHLGPGMEIEVALRSHDLPHVFPEDALREARTYSPEVPPEATRGRVDLRSTPLVTIDGEDARDFDDAVYAERQGKDFKLLVAIADVSAYVHPGSALDREALARGNSVYFPRRVIPMLPEELSNGLCSLNPSVDRLTMVCEMAITPQGEVARYEFYAAVIRSRARLTYTEVWQQLSSRKAPENLLLLYELFKALAEERSRRGAIDFDTLETRMVFDGRGKIEKIVAEPRNDAHRIIEECMLAANVCAGNFLAERKQPALYRVHDVPAAEKVSALREFLAEIGLQLPGGEIPRPKDYAQLLERIRKRPDFGLLQTILLRSLKQAVYSPSNVGHFGLAFEAYVHFTSPIRRYPDLLVHRAIKAVLSNQKYSDLDWEALGRHCSETERRADDASRDVENWLKCYYMRDHVGGTFSGSVTGVVPFGLFVTLDDYFVDGLVHISELGRDYFQYDAARHMLLGERTAKRFRLADRMTVKLVRVDLETRKIDFVPA